MLSELQFRGRRPDQGGRPLTEWRGRCVVEYRREPGAWLPLPMCNNLRNHSPDGPEWGYCGSGPAQLALALCAATVGAKLAMRVYQRFKSLVVAGLDDELWHLSGVQVWRAIARILELQAEDQMEGGAQ